MAVELVNPEGNTRAVMKTGDIVHTPYGEGKLLLYREIDRIYVVDLAFAKATLYAAHDTLKELRPNSTTLSNTPGHSGEHPKPSSRCQKDNTMELNVAYEALESMRKLNLELQLNEMGFFALDLDRCTTCLFEEAKRQLEIQQKQKEADANGKFAANWLFRRSNSSDTSSLSASVSRNAKTGDPCLICGSPACKMHSCSNFRKEGITLCLECSQLFKLDFVIDCLTSSIENRSAKIDRMVETYDRTLLLLRYSSQFIDDLAKTLEQKMVQQNKVQVGSSASGIVSGTLGVASAVMIFTPVGPPLLIASLLFGASATAVQSGSKAMNYHSDSNKLADRILALYGMLNSILRLAGTLRDAMLRDHSRADMYVDKHLHKLEYPEDDDILSKHSAELMAGMTLGRAAAASAAGLEASAFAATASAASMGASETISFVETGAVAGRSSRLIARSSMTALQTARFVQFAGGAISACTLLLEAHCMSQTIQAIKAGNPCVKADLLRAVKANIETANIPLTAVLDDECHRYLSILAQRERAMTEKEVVNILLAFSEEAKAAKGETEKVFMEEDEAVSTGIATDFNESDHDSDDMGTAEESSGNEQKDVAVSKVTLSPSRTAPLTPRSKISLFARITKHKKEQLRLSPSTAWAHRRSQPSTELEDPREVSAPRASHGAYVDNLIV